MRGRLAGLPLKECPSCDDIPMVLSCAAFEARRSSQNPE
jgi:hypothetical protein